MSPLSESPLGQPLVPGKVVMKACPDEELVEVETILRGNESEG